MARLPARRLLLLTFFTTFLRAASADAACYFPDGSESGDTPCSNDANTEVFCCPSGSTCISDPGPLCRQSNGDYVRGSCTVQDWSSSACPKFCLAINSDNPVDRCSTAAASGNFCCGYDADADLCSCDTNNNTFPLLQYTPIVTLGPSSTTSSTTSSTSSTTTAPSAAAVTDASSTSSSTTATATGTATGTPAPSSGLSTGAKVGLGVGIPLGLAVIGLIGFLFWSRGKQRQDKLNSGHSSGPVSELHGEHYYAPPTHYTTDPKPQWAHQNTGYMSHDGSGTLSYGPHSANTSTMHELPAQSPR